MDPVFKVPRPVSRPVEYSGNKFMNTQLRNGSELSFRTNRNNIFCGSFNLSRNIGNTSQMLNSIKVPKLDAEYRNNETQQMSFPVERAAASSATNSHSQFISRKNAIGPGFSAVEKAINSSSADSFLQTDSRRNATFSSGFSAMDRGGTSSAVDSHLQIVPRTNPMCGSSFSAIEKASTLNSTDSHSQIDRRKNAMFSSGLSFSSSTELVQRGRFNSTFNNLSSRRQNSILSNSSRLPFNITANVDDNQSLAGSVMSTTSNLNSVAVSAQLMNIFEALENTLLKKHILLSSEKVKEVCRNAKEMALNSVQNEQSLALSYRGGDGASVFSESAKSLCSTFSKNHTQVPLVSSTKSHREVLAELKLNKQPAGQISQVQFLTSFETSKRNVDYADDGGNDDDDDDEEEEENDRTMFFKETNKQKISVKKKDSGKATDQRLMLKKDSNSKQAMTVIVLKHWFPVAVGANLALSGTTEQNDCIETKPIKKRINNRKVELVDGKTCEIIGSPAASVVSAFPKDLLNKVKNGLHAHWKVLQKDLANCQKNFNNKKQTKENPQTKGKSKNQIVECTPRTRKVAQIQKIAPSPSPLDSSTPLRRKEPDGLKNNVWREPVVVLERSDLSIVKYKESKAKSKVNEKITENSSKEKKKKIVDVPVREKSKNNEEPVMRTKSGRTVKPLGDFWKDGSIIFKSKAKRMETDDTLKPKKRKLEEHEKENQVKRPKIKKPSPEKKNNKKSPELSDSSVSIPSPKKKGTPVPRNLLSKKNSSKNSKVETKKKNEKGGKNYENKKKEVEKKITKSVAPAKQYNDSFEYSLGDIEVPQVEACGINSQLSKSQIRMISMETPPLKYFTGNLRLANSVTPVTPATSPTWQPSQRTESEVKKFQKRREKTFKQKIPVEKPQLAKTRKSPRNKDVDNVMDWIADKDVKSPKKRSKLVDLVIPSRRQEEEDDEDESDDGDYDE